jgi:arylsulfatase A-like enzyme
MIRWLLQRRVWVAALTLALSCGILLVSQATKAIPVLPTRPNIVFVYTDDQTQESITPQAMPYLSGDPQGYWWKGDLIYNNSQCCPSRAAFLSGQDGHNNGVTDNNSGQNLNVTNTIAKRLHDGGYFTCKVGKYLNAWPFGGPMTTPPGWDRWSVLLENAPDDTTATYYRYTMDVKGVITSFDTTPPKDYATYVFNSMAQGDCLDQLPTDKPFFLDLSFVGPHIPFIPAPEDIGAPVSIPPKKPNFNVLPANPVQWELRQGVLSSADAKQWRTNLKNEYLTLRSVDRSIKSIMDKLQSLGLLDDTIVVFTSDNTNSFGEHGYTNKRCYYDECLRMPLWIRYPLAGGTQATRTNGHLIGNIDIAPTLAELGGTDLNWSPINGRSLVPFLRGQHPTSWRSALLLENRERKSFQQGARIGRFWGLRTSRYTYVELNDTGETVLFDHAVDPYERSNVASSPPYGAVASHLHDRLAAQIHE